MAGYVCPNCGGPLKLVRTFPHVVEYDIDSSTGVLTSEHDKELDSIDEWAQCQNPGCRAFYTAIEVSVEDDKVTEIFPKHNPKEGE